MPDDDTVTIGRQELAWLRDRSDAFHTFETADKVEITLMGSSWVWARQHGGPSLSCAMSLRQRERVA